MNLGKLFVVKEDHYFWKFLISGAFHPPSENLKLAKNDKNRFIYVLDTFHKENLDNVHEEYD